MAAGRRETSRVVVLNADMLGVSMCEEFGCGLWWTEAKGESNECLCSEGGSGYRSAVLLVGVLMHGPLWRGDWYAE